MDFSPSLFPRLLVMALAGAVVLALAAASAQARPDHRGWRAIRPGPMHWTALILSAGLTCLLAYVWLFVGSSRPDAERQMNILFWLIVAFGGGGLIAGWSILAIGRRATRWRGQTIVFAGPDGETTRAFADVEALASSPLGSMRIIFRDGVRLVVDPYAKGASELLDKLAEFLATTGSA